ncbi:uroporphyrinogen-III C-methyltransferase [Magnetospirillum sp. UT-4]|uniref:uroporphyrinogen-III C-methyltransferase n=1 Tax=Magnetospirillum sp. UT-4 TaxID=2681467 RepID=UPI001384E461|nr:uroporphyrinogen-III C-methyltransferase [Magnetospirillum sp. UT-4]CAA7624257.1 Uroporphyrinogen-III C-methyltransferase [Magnetospirillum sp. UT-4]
MMHRGKVHLVGSGPGDPELLTLKAARLIAGAGVVVFDRLVGESILDLLPAGARRMDVGKETGRHAVPQAEINRLLVGLAMDGHDVVRLKGGDPFIFGRGGEEAQALAAAGIPFEVVPGITAASGCAAASGIPLTLRGIAEGVRLVTGHRQDDGDLDLDWASLADPRCTLVVYMGVASAERMAAGLVGAGLPADTPVAIIERGTTPEQRTWVSRLGCLTADMERWAPKPPALLVIGRVVDHAVVSGWPALAEAAQ